MGVQGTRTDPRGTPRRIALDPFAVVRGPSAKLQYHPLPRPPRLCPHQPWRRCSLARSGVRCQWGYERAIALKEPRAQEDPTNTEHRHVLVCACGGGLSLRDLGNSAGAAVDFRRALTLCDGLPPRSAWDFFEMKMACCHAALADMAGRAGSDVWAAERQIEADKAMDWLRRAVAAGYRNANELRIESALDPLRDRGDFRNLILDMAFPVEPFASAD